MLGFFAQISAFIRGFLTSSDAAAARSAIGAGNSNSYTALIGDGSATTYTISAATHGLAASNKHTVAVYDVATTAEEIPGIAISNATGAVTITFSIAPASNSKRVVIQGSLS
jgi:hypothetical protein